MDFLSPRSWDEALAAKAERPDAVPISGGTDLMVELNFDRRRPDALLDLNGVAELAEWQRDGRARADRRQRAVHPDHRRDRRRWCPGLAIAVAHRRLAADPQPRHARRQPRHRVARRRRAAAARHRRRGRRGRLGPGRPHRRRPRVLPRPEAQRARARRADPRGAGAGCGRAAAVRQGRHPQRDGDLGLLVRRSRCTRRDAGVAGCIGSAGPTVLRDARCRAVRRRRAGLGRPAGRARSRRSPRGSASWPRPTRRPIDDVRGTAAYRRHAVGVLARRTLTLGLGRVPEGAAMRVDVRGQRRAHEADDVWPGESLLYVLRERMGLPGTKNACEQGECGSCSVYLDGTLVCACLVAAAQAQGRVGAHGRRTSADRGRAAPGPAGVPRHRRGAVRLLHAGPDRRGARPARPQPAPVRRRDPRGAGRQPVPLHRLREDPRRRPARRRTPRPSG